MPSDPQPSGAASILAAVVLYKQAPSESGSLSRLLEALDGEEQLASRFSLLIYDNSPQPQRQDLRAKCEVRYRHDPANGGLAAAYNFALTMAKAEQFQWLLLLDQDTSLTVDFLRELVECSEVLQRDERVGAIVPKLLVKGKVYSPAAHFVDQLRRQYRRSNHAVPADALGIHEERLAAYNSGALLRVSAVDAVGGFPSEYWLDYLDHAVFHKLWASGYRTYVMRAQVAHEVSQAAIEAVPVWRQRNLLLAQSRFVKATGNWFDRWILYRIWLLRHALMLFRRYPDRRLWRDVLLEACGLRP